MADKIIIDIYRKKPIDELSEILSRQDSKLETGSSCAAVATLASSLLIRSAHLLADSAADSERVEYILRNAEKLREYMFYLIDEDVKCRGPIKRALAEGGEEHIEACIQPAIAICSEIISMMATLLGFAKELCELKEADLPHYLFEASEYALSSVKSAVSYIYSMLSLSHDDTFIYVTRRENEITYKEIFEVYSSVCSHFSLPF